jgi:DnaJ-class molecular chaperone
MPNTNPHPDDRCSVCAGEGEIETSMTCANVVDNCECDSESAAEMEECSECHGTGDPDAEEDDDAEEAA